MNTAKNIKASNDEWYVLKGDDKFGPYTYYEMIRLMQDSLVQNYDFVWAPHLDAWTGVHELSEFSQDRIHRVFEALQEEEKNSEMFKRREHERVYCELPIFAHDHSQFWEGRAENLSQGGALVFMHNPLLIPGSVVNIHIRQSHLGVGMNFKAEVISKRLVRQKISHDTGLHYAVRFLDYGKYGDNILREAIKKLKAKID